MKNLNDCPKCRECGKPILRASDRVYQTHEILGRWPVAKSGRPVHKACR